MRIINDTYSGRVEIYDDYVIKIFNEQALREGLYRRELHWLKKLERYDRVPTVLDFGSNNIKMTYVGERITKETLPVNWQKQIIEIYLEFQKYECCHNDIKPEDILVLNDRLHIVDFGWATTIFEEIPSHWDISIGAEFALGPHDFDDYYSLNKSCEYIKSLE